MITTSKRLMFSIALPIFLFLEFGFNPQSIGLLPFAAVSFELFISDIKFFRIPNKIVYTTFSVTLLYMSFFAIAKSNLNYVTEPLIVSISYFSVGLVLYIIGRDSFGAGDVKLLALAGLNLGYFSNSLALFAGLLTFGLLLIFAIIILIFKKASVQTQIPFGPFLLVSTWFSIFTLA